MERARVNSPRSAARLAVLIFVAFGAGPLGVDAHAQSRVGFQVSVGAAQPLGAALRLVPEVQGGALLAEREDVRLYNWHPRTGFAARAELVLNELTVGYGLETSGWGDDRQRCTSSLEGGEPTLRGDGAIDDLGVDYSCGHEVRLRGDPGDHQSWVTHSITGGYRIYANRVARPAIYGLVTGGFVFNTTHANEQRRAVRLGVRVGGGGGLDFYLDPNVALNLEAAYEFSLYGKSGSYVQNAYRASEAGKSVLASIFEPTHGLRFTLGLRIYIK